jgi:nucleoside-diphosphate-sugar epimerase
VKVLVTGASGFVGTALLPVLRARHHIPVAAVRHTPRDSSEIHVGEINGKTDWSQAIGGCRAVIHLAAHIPTAPSRSATMRAQTVNVDGTIRLAEAAAAAGVARFVFMSSIKVFGECNAHDRPFDAKDRPNPKGPYAESKLAAEEALARTAKERGFELVIIRPPMVYGPGAKSNIHMFARAIRRGIPLPLASVRNRRSFIGVRNLADLTTVALEHPLAPDRILLPSDGKAISTADFARRIGIALGHPARLMRVPIAALRLLASMPGVGRKLWPLIEDLSVDSGGTEAIIGWKPPFRMEEELAHLAGSRSLVS